MAFAYLVVVGMVVAQSDAFHPAHRDVTVTTSFFFSELQHFPITFHLTEKKK